ncbi:MAG: ribosomal RNA small subunit methyltransferase A [Zetaproteobacteria bacterium CG12_big_fil_rev_8_21_14_0_65_55_1124]|nr:MAG: ribosomal RNA small subunit methyltransferase A [Zetaproteobacteria bacterium CG1_02_55_237]PIS20146.1 MAG: ribosomal RNA small subunit methyltransferase A [Zetaproteobacteria bacterium CG08_land_8_20_14_0_20_55_17]PIW42731.1 MAG: ribosomal RNA small subunit methyltransferase A [Zetaproteobacteria bacterium CG12_big_fil_rev_8_21_14_0_65_55_1124]PIY53745.1 MAG: ribosomal RNA small subunit methyltransferase A [Zetaproteobacteria bacterium CG_4_10_14_0_8_um_filter_55_43]PIZ38793.1 MAG: rib
MGNFDQGRAKKSLGQHFLVDRSAIARIAAAIPEGASTLEIGPGRGAITESLLKRVGKLVLIEKDDDLAAMWQERAESEDRLTLVHGDVMQCLLPTVAGHQPAWIAGNLPYNISGPLSAALFSLHLPGGLVLMYQREVADRINADAGSKTYGGLSVLARHFYDVKRLLVLPPGAFNPPPKVHSAVLLLTPHGREPACPFDDLQRTVRQGFAHRRKTINNNFRGDMSAEDWASVGIDPGTRPERLDYPAWARLATFLTAKV